MVQALLPVATWILARRPNRPGMLDFTRIGGLFRPVGAGAVIDALSRNVLSLAVVLGGPSARAAGARRRRPVGRHGAPRWLVTDRDPVLRSRFVNALLTAG